MCSHRYSRLNQVLNICVQGLCHVNDVKRVFPLSALLDADCCRRRIPFKIGLMPELSKCLSGNEMASVIEEVVDLTVC